MNSTLALVENFHASIPQFIVGEDGTCGLVYEHAPAEGPPIVFLIDYVVKYMYGSFSVWTTAFPCFRLSSD